MASGTLSIGRFVVTDESFSLNELVDVTADAPASGETIVYKDSSVDASFTTGWHSTALTTNDLSDSNTSTAVQNDVLAYNDNALDATWPTAFVPKNVGSIFSDLEATVNSIVAVNTAKIQAEAGNPAKTDMVLFSATPSATGETCSVCSNGSNNIISKKEPTEGAFSFVQTLGKGEKMSETYPAGTILRSSKGIYGLSGPFPTPLGPQSFALDKCQFYVSGAADLNIVSLGTEVTVSLFSGDRLTTLAGPTIVAAYQVASFSCPATGEYFVSSSGPISACVNQSGSNIRLLAPMLTELITWNPSCRVSALEATTTVTYYQRTGATATVSVSPGTSVELNAGSGTFLNPTGCLRITADKPISTFTGSDGAGNQCLAGFPLSQMGQLFCNPSFIGSDFTYSIVGVAIASLYEGTATVYTSTGAILDTFTYVRSNPTTTADDQQYPSAGRWAPSAVSSATTWDGGYIETNTPAVCIMNSSGDSIWGSAGEEMWIVGSTPDDIRADIKKIDGLWRRRDISSAGVVSWNVC